VWLFRKWQPKIDRAEPSKRQPRRAKPNREPSVLTLLTVSIALAVLILGMVWFVFFRI